MRDNDTHIVDADGELVSAAKRGDLAAFELLVHRHQDRMLNIAFRIVGVYEDACEVVQDAFVAAYRGLDRFRGDARFTTWLTAITANLSRNRRQQLAARRRNEGISLDDPLPTDDGELVPDPPSPAPGAQEELERQEVARKVRECIAALDNDFREVLVLRDMEDFSYEEIGVALTIREGTVKSRLFRAREAVKDCLKRVLREL
jgi:RNA polymerase sigma-70 factor (ECF subfamily)